MNNFDKITFILILFLAFSCITPKSSLSYGHYIKKTSRTLRSIPNNSLQFQINDFDLYFSVDEMVNVLDDGITKFSAIRCIDYIKENLSGNNLKIYKINNKFHLNKTIIKDYEISYYIEYSLDRLVKKGSLYITRSGVMNKKIYYKKWVPKIQGTINSKWISENGVEINIFEKANVN